MTNSIKIKHNLFKYIGCMLIVGLIAFSFTSCSKDDEDPVPEKPKTEEEIQAELREELRTTMGFNSNYKSLLYSSLTNPDFKSAKDFSKSFTSIEQDYTNNKYMSPNLVIDKKGVLWFSVSGTFYFFENYKLEKDGDIFTIKCNVEDMFQLLNDGTTTKPNGMGYTLLAKYNIKTGETLRIAEALMEETIVMVTAIEWIQDSSITKPSKAPVGVDPNDYIDF